MKDHTGCVRGFYHLSKAWYGKSSLAGTDIIDEIHIGMYEPDNGTTGEFSIKWRMLAGECTPKLEAFNDSWDALQQFTDLLEEMAEHDDENISPDAFADMLITLGIKDLTQKNDP